MWTKEELERRDRITRIMDTIIKEMKQEIQKELDKRVSNFLVYGTTHPEAFNDSDNSK